MNDINNQEQSSKWIKCLEMALYYKPRDVEEQIKIATILYKTGKELESIAWNGKELDNKEPLCSSTYEINKDKTILQKVLDKIKN